MGGNTFPAGMLAPRLCLDSPAQHVFGKFLSLLAFTGAAAELRDMTGVWAAVRYLVAVGGQQTGLVKKHARWILTVDPEAGLEMFTEMQSPLPPDSVLPILANHAPALCATYLEPAIAQGSVSAQVRTAHFDAEFLLSAFETHAI